MTVQNDTVEEVNGLGITREEFEALSPQEKQDVFVKQAVAAGTAEADAVNVYKIITELSPPITVENAEVMGLPLGQAQLRVAREYDTTLTSIDLDGYTDLILHTPLGPVSFSVDKATLLAALTVEVPHVSPQKAPVDA